MARRFHTLDVFTKSPLTGNPLAVVRDCDGLDEAQMQAIAREFNLSETVFLLSPCDPVNTARARIFTPIRELPFAGHPTIGAAVLIGLSEAQSFMRTQDILIVIEEQVGPVACTVGFDKQGVARARFTLPKLPETAGMAGEILFIAQALGLAESDIGFGSHVPCIFSAGNPFCFVPVASLEAMARAKPDASAWKAAFGQMERGACYLYTRETVQSDHHFHARAFAPGLGIHEDPATGSAVAAFAGVLMAQDKITDGSHVFVIEQGYEMGRPSLISLRLDVAEGKLMEASIGGSAVLVQDGTLNL